MLYKMSQRTWDSIVPVCKINKKKNSQHDVEKLLKVSRITRSHCLKKEIFGLFYWQKVSLGIKMFFMFAKKCMYF